MPSKLKKEGIKPKSNTFVVYDLIKKIPKGKVTTYGQISLRLRASTELSRMSSGQAIKITPRMVGQILHNNPDPTNIPCHRVVDRNGRIASNYAFGGAKAQRELLAKEGVKFKDRMHVDVKACLWQAEFETRSTKS